MKSLSNLDQLQRSRSENVIRHFANGVNDVLGSGMITLTNDPKLVTYNLTNFCEHIFTNFISNEKTVIYGSEITLNITFCCLLRMIGIGCRLVTGFQTFSIFEKRDLPYIYDDNLSCLQIHDPRCDEHTWCLAFTNRNAYGFRNDDVSGWQYVDLTPHIKGNKPCGPVPIKCLFREIELPNKFLADIQVAEYLLKTNFRAYIWNRMKDCFCQLSVFCHVHPCLSQIHDSYSFEDLNQSIRAHDLSDYIKQDEKFECRVIPSPYIKSKRKLKSLPEITLVVELYSHTLTGRSLLFSDISKTLTIDFHTKIQKFLTLTPRINNSKYTDVLTLEYKFYNHSTNFGKFGQVSLYIKRIKLKLEYIGTNSDTNLKVIKLTCCFLHDFQMRDARFQINFDESNFERWEYESINPDETVSLITSTSIQFTERLFVTVKTHAFTKTFYKKVKNYPGQENILSQGL
ncbi:hypothetical protein RF11_12821 [Thelohanellus kitauei]|uniref:Uncharacterized protein n=1 Tax=Thelohanellus kitauei TaxID=669202 RepID=A0A0C2MIB4_THEKT|nr:hypothetical protein RF11_12821 [Thelohanellus kitauei]